MAVISVFSPRRILEGFLAFYSQGSLVLNIFQWRLYLFSHSVVF